MEFIACTWSLNIKDEDYPFYLLYGEKGSITVVRQTDDFLVVSYNSDRLRGRFIEIICDHYEATTTKPGELIRFNGLEIQQNLETGDTTISQRTRSTCCTPTSASEIRIRGSERREEKAIRTTGTSTTRPGPLRQPEVLGHNQRNPHTSRGPDDLTSWRRSLRVHLPAVPPKRTCAR